MNLIELFKKRSNYSIYDQEEINMIETSYVERTIKAYSPLIKEQIDLEATKMTKDKNYKSNYLEELAKANIFITKNVKCPNNFTKEMLIETAFSSYMYQKDNNFPFAKFEDFFSSSNGKALDHMKKVIITKYYPMDKNKNGFAHLNFLYLNPKMNYISYTDLLYETSTHEFQHKISINGTYQKHIISGMWSNKKTGINEYCTEYHAVNIVKKYMDKNIEKDLTYSFLKGDKHKEVTFKTGAKHYIEITQFYEPLNHIMDNKMPLIYYDRNMDFDNYINKNHKYLRDDFYNFVDKAFMEIREGGEPNKTLSEQNFDAMIDSFSSLAEKYVRNLGLNKSTTPESLEGAITFKKVEEFFNTFDSITFQKDGEKFAQNELIKEKILGAIYYNDKSSEEAINRINNERTFVKEFEENCNTATETIEKSKTSESEITTSIEKTKENETTKDNSKSNDLEL